jgi:hypothetical protein
MPPGRGVEDDGLVASSSLHFSHAVTESLEPAPRLGCAQIDKQSIAFGVGNRSPPGSFKFRVTLLGRQCGDKLDRPLDPRLQLIVGIQPLGLDHGPPLHRPPGHVKR